MATNGQEYKICIDRDEEIMDVVDRLRRTPIRDVILVVPQHAMLLHSGVNLKILAYESRRMDKNITIMTNDEDGMILAQRAQIATEHYRGDDLSQKTAYVQPPTQQHVPAAAPMSPHVQQPQRPRVAMLPQQPRRQAPQSSLHQQQSPQQPQSSTQQQFLRPSAQQKSSHDMSSYTTAPRVASPTPAAPSPSAVTRSQSLPSRMQGGDGGRPAPQRRMPVQQRPVSHDNEKPLTSRKPRIVAWGLVVLAVLVLVIVGLMALLPQSHIAVSPRRITIDEKVDVSARVAQTGVDAERRMIPARIIDRDITFTKTFAATGSGNADAQKAQGKITITNTDASAQPLVATTRFLAENGTLFRLANAVTVPGMRDGTPGTVEALVVADKAGTDGNIAPTTFRVPGLAGTAKADKVTAQSTAPMTGGGSGGNGAAIVTQDDLAGAKTTTEQETPADVEAQIAALLRPDVEVLLPGAVQMTQKQSEADMTAGTAQAEFHYTTVTHVRAIVFSQEDVRATVDAVFKERVASYGIDNAQFTIAYGDSDVDFDTQSVKMDARVTLDAASQVDVSAFKKDIIGKKHDDLRGIIEKNYAATIDKITISRVIPRSPAFIANRVSPVGFMTSVNIAEDK